MGLPQRQLYMARIPDQRQCLSDLTAYNAAFGAGNTSSTALAPTGNIGMEAAIMVNRSNATCD